MLFSNQKKMKHPFIIHSAVFIILILLACRPGKEYRKTIETFPDGKVKKEYVYPDKDNTSDYSVYEYFSDGKIAFKATVKNNQYVGTKIKYYTNGKCQVTDSISGPCGLNVEFCDGKRSTFFSNGKPYEEYEIKNGEMTGKDVQFSNDSSGTLSEITNYEAGKKHGEYSIYYPSGMISQKGMYENDKMVGVEYRFKENGDSLEIFHRYKGNPDVPWKKWLQNGEIFYADYIDSTRSTMILIWTDESGKEVRRDTSKGPFMVPD